MSNRNKGPVIHEGRVRKWRRRWLPYVKGEQGQQDEVRLELCKWIPTEKLSEQPSGPRHKYVRPVADTRSLIEQTTAAEQQQPLPGTWDAQAQPMQLDLMQGSMQLPMLPGPDVPFPMQLPMHMGSTTSMPMLHIPIPAPGMEDSLETALHAALTGDDTVGHTAPGGDMLLDLAGFPHTL